ncbi:MAG: hypothetical protein HY909_20165 [Deltaproteobacteria bacterium]|nr:hypothetical protein [Deltaproteobacteria bacterium]
MNRAPLLFIGLLALGCTGGDPVDLPAAPVGASGMQGPRVRWDLGARPLPEIPLPNDFATSPDSTSPTGLRINASLVAPTTFESRLREGFDQMDGWGTFAPLTVSFEEDLDLAELTRRMRGDDHRFEDDAVYLINMTTGVPVPLDMGDGNFQYTARNVDGYYPNDPRGGQSNLLFETVEEDSNRNGRLDPGEDTNFDGVLNRAAVWPPGSDPRDGLTTFWEPDTHTLIVRPVVPLEERTRYAVVLTDRLQGARGPVRSPFPTVGHPAQAAVLEGLDALLRTRHPEYYGGLVYRPRAGESAPRVVFAWTFTTQTTVSDLLLLREGLYGRGPFGDELGPVTPNLEASQLTGGQGCTQEQRDRPFVIRGEALTRLVTQLAEALGIRGRQRERLLEQYRYVDHVVLGTLRSPYLLGDPRSLDHHARWDVNSRTGTIAHQGVDTVQFAMTVPKAAPGRRAPFPLAFMGHGYTGMMLDALGYGPNLAAFGIATLGINAAGHGLALDPSTLSQVTTILRSVCASGASEPLLTNRARDINLDGTADSGGDFWTGYVFHTRDMVRQSVLDHMQVIRAFRGFDGTSRSREDYNHDGSATNDLAGDFDGDGVVDAGGPDAPYFATGGSLGGILSMILGSADAAVRATSPVAGGGGLTDVGIRSTQGGVKEAVILRVMGPLVMSIPATDYPRRGMRTRTLCSNSQNTLRFLVPDVNDTGELEIACLERGAGGGDDQPAIAAGDDVVVTNLRTNARRCARAAADGRFRIGIPSDNGDRLAVTIFRGSAIADYGTCQPEASASVKSVVDTFRVVEGDCDIHCGHIPENPSADARLTRVSERGSALRSPAEGMGIRRQTPEMRRFLLLAQAALDPGDPISFAPLYFLRRPPGHGEHAVMVVNTIGDQAVPLSTGNAFARAAGLLPFFGPNAPAEYLEYATPPALWARYNRTPNRVLVDRGVLEGLSSLGRFPIPGRDAILFDVDDLDEGRQRFGEQVLSPQPLRLVRYARGMGADRAQLAALWAPTVGEGYTGAQGPVGAVLNAYVDPAGRHGYGMPDPALPWDPATYLLNVTARFFATLGQDLAYRSRPTSHQCNQDHSCGDHPARPMNQ